MGLLLLSIVTAFSFLLSLEPSAEKEPPKLTIELDSIPLDSFVEIEWQNQPVIIFRPGPQTISGLVSLNDRTFPPVLDTNSLPPAFVYIRISTFRGCSLTQVEPGVFGSFWPGGWHDPCHFGAWDYSGRLVKGVSGSQVLPNLTVPLHHYTNGNKNVVLYHRA
jgi:Rieske Fe-S protein